MLEATTKYILNLVTENDEIKSLPPDFVATSIRWMRSWFVQDDLIAEKILISNKPIAAKEAFIEAKLEELNKSTEFQRELQEQLHQYQTHIENSKNVISNSSIHAGGNIHIGDVHYHAPPPESRKAPPSSSNFIRSMRALVASGRAQDALPQMADYTQSHAPHLYNEVLLLSSRYETLARKERMGVLVESEARTERNQISTAVLEILAALSKSMP